MTRFADTLLGETIDQMQRSGLWDDALVMRRRRPRRQHRAGELRRNVAEENFAQTAGIPFFVKRPGQTEGEVERHVRHALDVVPTVAEELGIDTDWEFDGVPVGEPRDVELLQQRNGPDAELIERDARGVPRPARAGPGRPARAPALAVGGRPAAGPGRRAAVGARRDADPGDWRAFLNNAPLYADVDPASGSLPVYVTGATTNVPSGTDLIVAVDGTIEASGEAYVDRGDPRFSMLVRPGVLTEGRHRVDILAVEGETARSLVSSG